MFVKVVIDFLVCSKQVKSSFRKLLVLILHIYVINDSINGTNETRFEFVSLHKLTRESNTNVLILNARL